ncbi:DUF3604 domain-containing protein [Hyphomonas johnsonii]|uniref:Lipoprotein n=1 Tax=Hyphomonas johnsonii MHS-2 TaxID=1280950 RepID=A0A059F9W5_9PROT|nr:DUF3604 domain-containing protein [Hyphomonas johnsonii]KCZ87333.1 hypothetical protein HJO_16842 [Hyphomonas johnsonii MHS-2]
MLKHLMLASATLALVACNGAKTEKPADTETAAPAAPAAPEGATPGYNADRNAYFGDTHIHTRNSFDAYIFNVRRTADDAYRFAKGETIKHPSGFDMTVAGGPLDFYTVTDHAEYLGILPAMNTKGTKLSELPRAADMFSRDPDKILAAFQGVGASVRSGEKLEELYDIPVINSAWQENVAAAEKYNEPGVFTTFSAYEFTSVTSPDDSGGFGGGNLHRNVFFRNEAPERAFSTLDSTNPEDLWDWMDEQRAEGRESIAIPHNSNVSDGQMFRLETYNGDPLDAAYAEQRMRNEPLVEVTQVKGTSETHPDLSPNDEWANFEIYDELLASYVVSKTNGSYVREAYQNGLKLQEDQGFDPFHFGLVGGSDSHVAGGAYSEKEFWSKVGIVDGLPFQRGSVPMPGITDWADQPENQITNNAKHWFSRWAASGLTGVWAEENTRDAIFDAFRRKETFATTGPRMKVRFFGSFGYTADMLDAPDLARKAYAEGVPMGADLVGTGEAPRFIAWAIQDANSAPLQRVQVVKVTSSGETVYDVACSGGATPDAATHRCPDNGASVDITTCDTRPGTGAGELKTLWTDPDFTVGQRATYYVRVLENPTCRWSTWEANRNGTPPNPALPTTTQERAYTSPIWYIPPA